MKTIRSYSLQLLLFAIVAALFIGTYNYTKLGYLVSPLLDGVSLVVIVSGLLFFISDNLSNNERNR
jgi:hypothetical protein